MADHLAVLDPGMQSTLQDLGRYGLQRFGISAAGAIDPMSMQIANALVGNARDEAVLELTLSGGTYRVEAEHCRLAVAGADMPLTIDGAPAAPYRAHDLKRGSVVSIGFARTGMRAYLAVAGRLRGRAGARQPVDPSAIAARRVPWACAEGRGHACPYGAEPRIVGGL